MKQTMIPPMPDYSDMARESGKSFSKCLNEGGEYIRLKLNHTGTEEEVTVPTKAVALFVEILESMAAGRGITLIPRNAELSTVEAADVLNVSRPFLIKLLEQGEIPFRKVGKHRRILMEDVIHYKNKTDVAREKVLDELAREAQENQMGYD